MKLRTCVTSDGKFKYGIHKPSFRVVNLRENTFLQPLGLDEENELIQNSVNFPTGNVSEPQAEWIYEVPNPLPFRGVTYIGKSWADAKALDPASIKLPEQTPTSMSEYLSDVLQPGDSADIDNAFSGLPETVQLTLASTSTDPEDLVRLARLSCEFVYGRAEGVPTGLRFEEDAGGGRRPKLLNHDLFEALVNNPALPDIYKEVMVLRPGVQGGSEIVGEWPAENGSHVFEYLRRNSYIPWGHYASNMADDKIRYSIADLSDTDFEGLRHLYYQRTYIRVAEQLGMQVDSFDKCLSPSELEKLRRELAAGLAAADQDALQIDATLWGWNYGFDFAASGYRLHASHQQVHQQFAMIPSEVRQAEKDGGTIQSYSCGDLVAEFVRSYREVNNSGFFDDYILATRNNKRMDDRKDLVSELVVYEDEYVMLFVPKAQTSQWELQLVTLGQVGNILEADANLRASLDKGILTAMRVLTGMGAKLVTVIEFPKRIGVNDIDQRLLYSFLPKIPYSMGAFSEAQLRYINGHYPEDFAAACRLQLESR